MYERLREAAGWVHRRERACTVSPTGLIHEAYLRLPDDVREDPASHVGRICRELNHVVVARARARNRQKRWGSAARETWVDDRLSGNADAEASTHEAIDVQAGLDRLEQVSPRLREVVRLRFEVGLTVAQVSEALRVSLRTVERDLSRARGRLAAFLRADRPSD